jgi:putative lipoprotein
VRSTRIVLATAALVSVVVWSSRGRAESPDPDPWLGSDKALHFGASATIAAGSYVVGASLFEARGHALIVGGSVALAIGVAKESLDLAGLGDPSWKDLAWDGVGIATGLLVAWSVDVLLRGVSDKRPLFVAPRVDRAGAGLELGVRF